MTTRERILASVVGGVILLWLASVGLSRYQNALDENRTTLRNVKEQLSEARLSVARGQQAKAKLVEWQKQSLPTDADIANSLYQDWLQQQLIDSGLRVTDLTSSRSLRAQTDAYREFSYTISAEGSLGDFVKFLYSFYQAGHLHRISQATVSPTEEDREVLISLTIDALALPNAPREDQLAQTASSNELPPLEELQDAVVARNVFSPFDASQEKTASIADEADNARVTAMTYGDGGWRMAIQMKDSGKIRYFRQGDRLNIGSLKGRIAELNGRRAVLESRGNRLQILLGQTLSEAILLQEQAG